MPGWLPPGRQAAADATLLYRFPDLRLPGLVSHHPLTPGSAGDDAPDYTDFIEHLRTLARGAGAALVMPVTVVSDTQFTGDHGGDAAAVVVGRLNFVDGIYSSQLGTGLALWHHEILTDNGPMTATDPNVLLENQFRPWMSSGGGDDIPFAGLAHLFTGRNLDGSTVGIAYLGVLCNDFFGYGVDQNLSNDTTSSLVFAHELGHNFGAPHDGEDACIDETFNGIMNPSINGSQEFSDCSITEMSDDVAAANCLIPNPDVEVFYIDGFEPDAR